MIYDHPLFCNRLPDFVDFFILTTNNSGFKFTLMENLPLELSDKSGTKFHHMISCENDSSGCCTFILRGIFHHMSLADFNLVACDFTRFISYIDLQILHKQLKPFKLLLSPEKHSRFNSINQIFKI